MDDELATTMTATPVASSGEVPAVAQLGRYQVLRELGAGGMGIVYAAFDPELERNVALKVLRPGLASDAEPRLLREARAMARLAHPNVVTVYDVGTADGRDYIAMELIDGQNLVEWLATERPSRAAVLAAFVAAGHGLATAHEANIVHRDFKPHNVLRSRRGRVVVTDFGLARESAIELPASRDTPNPLSGLTLSGALLGTPAYMAPEQWNSEEVTPATDQFAFCVALVEAFAGARPFKGDSVEALRDAVMRGPDRLDLSAVPRRFRAVLRRGLAIDPAQRWPTMHALLDRLARRTRVVVLGIALVATLALALVAHQVRSSPEERIVIAAAAAAAAACDAPVVAPASVWNADADHTVRAGLPEAADRLGAAFAHWSEVRANACTQPAANRAARLACLDKVLVRIDAVRRTRLLDPKMSVWGVLAQLFEPEACLREDPPRMPASYSDAAIVGLALRSGAAVTPDVIAAAQQAAGHDACARTYLAFIVGGPQRLAEAKSDAQLCGDDQAYAAAASNLVEGRLTQFLDAALPLAIQEVDRAVEHAAQPFLVKQFLLFRARVASTAGDLDAALGFLERAGGTQLPEFEARRLLQRITLLLARAGHGDLAAVQRDAAALRQLAPETADAQDVFTQTAAWLLGEVQSAHPALALANAKLTQPPTGPAVHGTVDDARGQPVAGATVTCGVELRGDAVGPGVALFDADGGYPVDLQTTTTDARGGFSFAHAAADAEVIAQRDDDRSLARGAAGSPRLVLGPTRRLHGTTHGDRGRGAVWIEASIPGQHATLIAPVREDGTFVIAGLPTGAVRLRALRSEASRASHGPFQAVTDAPLDVALPGVRALDVIVRGMAIDGADVWTVAGTVRVATVGALRAAFAALPMANELGRAILVTPLPELARRGDVIAQFRDAPVGPITVCATGIHLDRDDPGFLGKYIAQEDKQPVRCVTLDAAATHLVIEVPPMKPVE